MVDRPDWNTPAVPAVVDKPSSSIAFDGPGYIAEVEAKHNAIATGKPLPGTLAIGEVVVRALTNTPEGPEAALEIAAHTAGEIEREAAHDYGVDPAALNHELANLPPEMRDKIALAIVKNPGISLKRLAVQLRKQSFNLREQRLANMALARLEQG